MDIDSTDSGKKFSIFEVDKFEFTGAKEITALFPQLLEREQKSRPQNLKQELVMSFSVQKIG